MKISRHLCFENDFGRVFLVSQCNELGMSQMIGAGSPPRTGFLRLRPWTSDRPLKITLLFSS